MGVRSMNFLQYKTPDELKKATGLSVVQAIKIVDLELDKLKDNVKT